MSVRLSIRPLEKQLGSQWTDFHEILYLSIFRKSVEKIQVTLKSDKNKGYSAIKLKHMFDHIYSQLFLEF